MVPCGAWRLFHYPLSSYDILIPKVAGLAHLTSTDDTYKGYFIPKGTVVLGVIWCVISVIGIPRSLY
jgi:hypothetical protein